jgi:hypothetical protein
MNNDFLSSFTDRCKNLHDHIYVTKPHYQDIHKPNFGKVFKSFTDLQSVLLFMKVVSIFRHQILQRCQCVSIRVLAEGVFYGVLGVFLVEAML